MIDLPLWLLISFLFILGAFIGSFLNVCVYRIPQHDRLRDQLAGLSSPPSSCPHCGMHILWYNNMPVIGWLRLKGRCRDCQQPISYRYPLFELANGFIFVILFLFEIPHELGNSIKNSLFFQPDYHVELLSLSRSAQTWHLVGLYLYHLVLIEALLVASMIDFDKMVIPDASTLPAMCVGLMGAFASGYFFLFPVWYQNNHLVHDFSVFVPESLQWMFGAVDFSPWISSSPHLHGLLVSLCGMVVGGGIVWLVRIVGGAILKQEAMGFGDVILMAMIGSFIGWQAVIAVFFIAPVIAMGVVLVSLMFRRTREIPYGPYLSLATVVLLLGWYRLGPIIERIFSTGPLIIILAILALFSLVVTLQFIQFVKRLLGIPLSATPELIEEWTSADQLVYQSGEQSEESNRGWHHSSSSQRVIELTGRGEMQEQRWRSRNPSG